MLNRSIIIIKAKEPFLSWLSSLPEPENKITLDEINFDNTAYFLPEYEMDETREEILADYYDIIFEDQLGDWWTDPTRWPEMRDFATFKEWFDTEFHSLVLDLVDLPLKDE